MKATRRVVLTLLALVAISLYGHVSAIRDETRTEQLLEPTRRYYLYVKPAPPDPVKDSIAAQCIDAAMRAGLDFVQVCSSWIY